MANHASAEKRNRQRIERTARNRGITSAVRTAVKKARELIAKGDAIGARKAVADASRAIDVAASKGVLHRNAAARRIGRLAKALVKTAPAAP